MFSERRCPWCGHKTEPLDEWHTRKRATPSHLHFGQCRYCLHYYGQSQFVDNGLWFWGIILSVALTLIFCLFDIFAIWLLLPVLICVFMTMGSPLQRMTKEEEPIFDGEVRLTAHYEAVGTIERHEHYFLIPDFDEHPIFSKASPLFIHRIDASKRQLEFSFLYEHPDNQPCLSGQTVAIYTAAGKIIGNITVLPDAP